MLNIKPKLAKRIKLFAQLALLLAIGLTIALTLEKDIKTINFSQVEALIKGLSPASLIFFTLMGNLIAASATTYDFLISRYYGLAVKKDTIFNVSLFSYTLNNVFGFGGVTGVSVRSIYFKRADRSLDMVDYVLLLFPAFSAGLSLLSLLFLFSYRVIEPIVGEYRVLLWVIIAFALYLPLYFFLDTIFYRLKKNPKKTLDRPRLTLKLKLLGVSAINWGLTLIFFAVILRHFNNVKPLVIFSVFTFASMAGIISMLPGGVGSFDLITLLGFKNFKVPADHILAAIILFRVFNFFIPLMVSGLLFLFDRSVNKLHNNKDEEQVT